MAKQSLTNKYKALAKHDLGITTMDNEHCKALAFKDEDLIHSDVVMLNVAFSGKVDGGLQPGIEIAAAPSGTGKTSIGLKMLESFQKKFDKEKKEHVALYFDNEFGSRDILEGYDIDRSKVLHIPIRNIEEMHHNMLAMLEDVGDEKVFILVDSVGNLASKKELDDALDGKSVADMTRAKTLKAFFRQVTPYINLKRVYTYFIGHVYKEQGMFPKTVVSGGTGLAYAPNGRYMIGKSDIKDTSGNVIGHEMGLTIDKSRSVKHKSKIILRFTYGKGIEKYSYLPELAKEFGLVEWVKKRGYVVVYDDLSVPLKDAYSHDELWERVFRETNFKKLIEEKYKLILTESVEDE